MTNQFIHEIKEIRCNKNWSQLDLAQELGVDIGTVSRWERGEQRPSKLAMRQLERLKKKLHIN